VAQAFLLVPNVGRALPAIALKNALLWFPTISFQGAKMRMKVCRKILALLVLVIALFLVDDVMAGQGFLVTCTTPGCGYQTQQTTGGTRKSPGMAGYCLKEKKFVYLKLKSHDDFHKPHDCPNCGTRLVGIRNPEKDIPLIPCPQCGKLNLQYKLLYRKD
jgi:hypothetical protein